jgi:hypothetical protein
MKTIRWSEEKNQILQLQRSLSFEMVLDAMEEGAILARMFKGLNFLPSRA